MAAGLGAGPVTLGQGPPVLAYIAMSMAETGRQNVPRTGSGGACVLTGWVANDNRDSKGTCGADQ